MTAAKTRAKRDRARFRRNQERRREARERAYLDITLEHLHNRIERLLIEKGERPESREAWSSTALAQLRLSKDDFLEKDGPSRQLGSLAHYCCEWRFNPIALSFEITSAFAKEDFDRRTR